MSRRPGSPKVALVVGGTSSVGAACARALHADDFMVAVTYHGNRPRAEELADELEARCDQSTLVSAYDLADTDGAAAVVGSVVEKWGALDVVVGAAWQWPDSGPGPRDHPLDQTPLDSWQGEVTTNVAGYTALAAAALPHLRESGDGRFIAVGTSTMRYPVPHAATYLAGKSYLRGLVAGLAWDGGRDGVTANLVNPGWICDLTHVPADVAAFLKPLHDDHAGKSPLGRLVTVDDIAYAVAFLASPQARNITNSVLDVTAGY